MGGDKRKYEEVVEQVHESQGLGVLRSRGPKDQDISESHSNTSLILKKLHLVFAIFHYQGSPCLS